MTEVLAEVLVLGEQVVQHPQGGLQVEVDDVLRSRFGLRQASIHHQLKSQADVGNFFVKGLTMKNVLNIHKNSGRFAINPNICRSV